MHFFFFAFVVYENHGAKRATTDLSPMDAVSSSPLCKTYFCGGIPRGISLLSLFPLSSHGTLRVPIAPPPPLPSKCDSASIQMCSSFHGVECGEKEQSDMEKRKRCEEKEERGTDAEK